MHENSSLEELISRFKLPFIDRVGNIYASALLPASCAAIGESKVSMGPHDDGAFVGGCRRAAPSLLDANNKWLARPGANIWRKITQAASTLEALAGGLWRRRKWRIFIIRSSLDDGYPSLVCQRSLNFTWKRHNNNMVGALRL